MRFVLSANRANDPSNTAFWINIGTEHFPPSGCLASPSTHDSVNIDQTRRSVFFTCIGNLHEIIGSTQTRVLRDLITSVVYEERGCSVDSLELFYHDWLYRNIFCLIIRYVSLFIYVCTIGNIHCIWHMHIAMFTLLRCHLNHTTTLEKGATTMHRWSS